MRFVRSHAGGIQIPGNCHQEGSQCPCERSATFSWGRAWLGPVNRPCWPHPPALREPVNSSSCAASPLTEPLRCLLLFCHQGWCTSAPTGSLSTRYGTLGLGTAPPGSGLARLSGGESNRGERWPPAGACRWRYRRYPTRGKAPRAGPLPAPRLGGGRQGKAAAPPNGTDQKRRRVQVADQVGHAYGRARKRVLSWVPQLEGRSRAPRQSRGGESSPPEHTTEGSRDMSRADGSPAGPGVEYLATR